MNFKNKGTDAVGFGILVMSFILGINLFGAQEPVVAQTAGVITPSVQPTPANSNFNAAGYEATPMPVHHHKHKNLMTANKISGEGVQPGKAIGGENPTITMVPVGTVPATPNTH